MFSRPILICAALLTATGLLAQANPAKVQVTQTDRQANSWQFFDRSDGMAYLLIGNDRLEFDHAGNLWQAQLPDGYLRCAASRNGTYIATLSMKDPESSSVGAKQLQIHITSNDGQTTALLNLDVAYDAPIPLVLISDSDGSITVADAATARLYFYSPSGTLEKTVVLFPQADYDLERVLQMDISADGGIIAVAAARHASSPSDSDIEEPSAQPQLFLFTGQGTEIWRRRLPLGNVRACAISADGAFFAASTYEVTMSGEVTKKLVVYARTGEVVLDDEFLFEKAVFAENSALLVVAEKRRARAYDLVAARPRWTLNTPEPRAVIAAIATSATGARSAFLMAETRYADGEFVFKKPMLKVISGNGDSLYEETFSDAEFIGPALHLSGDGKEIALGFRNKYVKAKVQ